MQPVIRNLCMIRQHGRICHYFDIRNTRENYAGLIFADKMGWRVVDSFEHGDWVTIKCHPIRVKNIGTYEQEIEKKDWDHD